MESKSKARPSFCPAHSNRGAVLYSDFATSWPLQIILQAKKPIDFSLEQLKQ